MEGQPKGYILIAGGTSMLVTEIYEAFQDMTDTGLDVYLFNYRGYGCTNKPATIDETLSCPQGGLGTCASLTDPECVCSEGNPSFHAAISDMLTAIRYLNSKLGSNGKSLYKYRFLYGISLGGIIITNAIQDDATLYDGVIFDSVPSTIFFYVGCPDEMDPKEILKSHSHKNGVVCKQWRAIAGSPTRDKVINSSFASRGPDLIKQINKCGGTGTVIGAFGHMFMDSATNTRERLDWAKDQVAQLMDDGR